MMDASAHHPPSASQESALTHSASLTADSRLMLETTTTDASAHTMKNASRVTAATIRVLHHSPGGLT